MPERLPHGTNDLHAQRAEGESGTATLYMWSSVRGSSTWSSVRGCARGAARGGKHVDQHVVVKGAREKRRLRADRSKQRSDRGRRWREKNGKNGPTAGEASGPTAGESRADPQRDVAFVIKARNCGACRQESVHVQGTRRLQWVRLFLRSFVLDKANLVEEFVLLSALLHICGVEENLGSEVVFWIDEWSIEFGYHWFDVAHVHDHSTLSAPLRRY